MDTTHIETDIKAKTADVLSEVDRGRLGIG
jgi:hypothetical protein